ncbi:hypothetical protein [Alkalicoccobacillus murimartini]|uniref:DUF4177 domain-containing protein n=1 Tax=Alkalicoccobacillus murimartini TaxID=171685 RepID=A0ABT9YFD3_9BACI|nr:hypothetical protein [Alkalicoccobacillus murimartini]MDQ0206251.1 hypothetical protein [Alkalicoccobacillus murimartini]
MEYKVIKLPYVTTEKSREKLSEILNEEAANGWILDHLLQSYMIFGITFNEQSAVLRKE